MSENTVAEFKEDVTVENEESFEQGVKDCIPTLLGYLSIGFAAGVIEKTAGMSILEIILMGLLLYAGSAQFTAAAMIMAGASISSTVFTVFLVNLRHLLLSASITPYFKGLSKLKSFIIGFELTDETFVVAAGKGAKNKKIGFKWMLGLNTTAHLNWILANVLGGIFGGIIEDPSSLGLDFALPAMFIGLLVIQICQDSKYKKNITIAILTAISMILCSRFFSGNISIIIATVIGATIGVVMDKWK
jgi:4-azaleucine resistance transporter AzlC